MFGSILKVLGGGKIMWITIAVLGASTLALGATAKHLYTKKVETEMLMEVTVAQYETSISMLNESIKHQAAVYESLKTAFKSQQEDYAAARRESKALRGRISDLSKASPPVKEYLDTPVPTELYNSVFPPETDN